jgi:hypothetical protein
MSRKPANASRTHARCMHQPMLIVVPSTTAVVTVCNTSCSCNTIPPADDYNLGQVLNVSLQFFEAQVRLAESTAGACRCLQHTTVITTGW